MIAALQILSGLSWALVAILLARPAWRFLRHGEDGRRNVHAVLVMFIAITQTGFTARWLIFDHSVRIMGSTEVNLWAALYLMNSIGALTIAIASARGLFDR